VFGQFLQAVFGISWTDNLLLVLPLFLCHLPVVLRFLLGDMGIVSLLYWNWATKYSGWVTLSLLLPGVGWAISGDIIIYALGNPSIMVAFIHQNSKSIYAQNFSLLQSDSSRR
jgi:hypothetical protein